MSSLQNDLNDIGASMRELHSLADASGDPALASAAADLHDKLATGFVKHIRPDHPDLDWSPIAGGAPNESGGKHEPPAEL